jgi:hypothetical protein
MNTTPAASPELACFDWESRVGAPVLSIGEVGIPVFGDPSLAPQVRIEAVAVHQS